MKGLGSGIVTFSISAFGIVVQMKGLGSGIVTFSISAYGVVVQMKELGSGIDSSSQVSQSAMTVGAAEQ